MAHTPGAWKVLIGKEYCFHDTTEHSIVAEHPPSPENGFEETTETIAEVWPGPLAGNDANLIAAAPELLELTYAFQSYLEDDSRSERRRTACLQAIASVRAKAEGR